MNDDKEISSVTRYAHDEGEQLIQDRYDSQQPQCGFGIIGVCCRICNAGPCRIDPITNLPERGICGAGIPLIVTRNWLRRLSAGAASRLYDTRRVVNYLQDFLNSTNKTPSLNTAALKRLVLQLDIKAQSSKNQSNKLIKAIHKTALNDLNPSNGRIPTWLKSKTSPEQINSWKHLGMLPTKGEHEIIEGLKRSGFGVNADPFGNVQTAMKIGILTGRLGLSITCDFLDLLLPVKNTQGSVGLGTLSPQEVNILLLPNVDPLLYKVLPEAVSQAKLPNNIKAINLVGVGSSGLELLRTNSGNALGETTIQEQAIASGLVDIIVRGNKDGYQSTTSLAKKMKTPIVTTSDLTKVKDSIHLPIQVKNAQEVAKTIVAEATASYQLRRKHRKKHGQFGKPVALPIISINDLWKPTTKPLADTPLITAVSNQMKNGAIQGIVLVFGENFTTHKRDAYTLPIVKELLKNNFLLFVVGDPCLTLAKNQVNGGKQIGAKLRKALQAFPKLPGITSLEAVLNFGPEE
ncbi:MAG: hypothetical protein ACXACA_06860, partial [Candidatus Ranarchaeia archaeon]